jgi:hypothetical protein
MKDGKNSLHKVYERGQMALSHARPAAAPIVLGRRVLRARTGPYGDRSELPGGVRERRAGLGVRLCAQGDDVGELGHGLEVADLRQAASPSA